MFVCSIRHEEVNYLRKITEKNNDVLNCAARTKPFPIRVLKLILHLTFGTRRTNFEIDFYFISNQIKSFYLFPKTTGPKSGKKYPLAAMASVPFHSQWIQTSVTLGSIRYFRLRRRLQSSHFSHRFCPALCFACLVKWQIKFSKSDERTDGKMHNGIDTQSLNLQQILLFSFRNVSVKRIPCGIFFAIFSSIFVRLGIVIEQILSIDSIGTF